LGDFHFEKRGGGEAQSLPRVSLPLHGRWKNSFLLKTFSIQSKVAELSLSISKMGNVLKYRNKSENLAGKRRECQFLLRRGKGNPTFNGGGGGLEIHDVFSFHLIKINSKRKKMAVGGEEESHQPTSSTEDRSCSGGEKGS